MFFFFFDANLNFQQPLIKSSVSHDPSEIILACRFVLFIIIITVENSSVYYFCGNCFYQDSLINRNKKLL